MAITTAQTDKLKNAIGEMLTKAYNLPEAQREAALGLRAEAIKYFQAEDNNRAWMVVDVLDEMVNANR